MELIGSVVWRSLSVLFIFTLSAESSLGDLIIQIENEFTAPGSIALVGVFATSNANDTISGFNLPIDFGADGKRPLPTGFTLRSPQLTNLLFGNTRLDVPEPQITFANIDGIASGFVAANQAVQLSATPTKLFDIAFEVDSAVPPGTVLPIHIVQDALGLFNVTSPSGGVVSLPSANTPSVGSLTVTAVPEPSILLQLATGIALCAFSRRYDFFRKKQRVYKNCPQSFER